jgi:hypothetical protein
MVVVEIISMSSLHSTFEGYCCGEHSSLPFEKLNLTALGLLAGPGGDFLLPVLFFGAFSFFMATDGGFSGVNPAGVGTVKVGGVSVVVIVLVSTTVATTVVEMKAVLNTVDVLLYVSVTTLPIDVEVTV